MPKVSVIIPCYNQGRYIDEAVDSVLAQTFQDFEIIIINDGSTEYLTNVILKNYNKPKTKVIHIKNQGVSIARNSGIKASQGKYMLSLDADDKIHPDYLIEAVKILDINNEMGIVYCEAEFFGEKNGKIVLPEFSIENMLISNHMFCSALFKKSDFNKTNGYNQNMKHGLEDWDFWLSLLELNIKVYKIPKVLFFYRIKQHSRNTEQSNDKNKFRESLQQIYLNHIGLYNKYIESPVHILAKLHDLEINYFTLNNQIELIKKSKSYRLGKLIIKPFSVIKRILKNA